MTELDVRSPTTRILECAKCDQLVSGEATGVRLELHCGHCGFDDVRELGVTRPADDARGRRIEVNLSVRPSRVRRTTKVADARRQWVDAKRALSGDVPANELHEREYRALWIAANLATSDVGANELLRARGVLETALELMTTPAYRAIALARLARVAAMSDAPELAEKWLDACPRGLDIPEVTSEIEVVAALLAKRRNDPKAVLEATGCVESDTVDEFVGAAKALALALRIDAYETLGDRQRAWELFDGSRATTRGLELEARSLRLAPKTRSRVIRAAISAIVGAATIVAGVVMLASRLSAGEVVGQVPFAMLVGGLVVIGVGQKV